jgi:hypothetical protein
MTIPDFSKFVSLVAARTGEAANRLPEVHVTCPLYEFALERQEYRMTGESDSSTAERMSAVSGEKAMLEVGSDMVRLSLKIAYEGPDSSQLTRHLEDKFFKRLARTGLACIRRKPVTGFDLTLIFTCHDSGQEVETLLLELLPLCRKLSKQLRFSQVIENRRAGKSVFSKLVQVIPKPKIAKVSEAAEAVQESVNDGACDIESAITEIGDLGKIEDFKDDEIDKNEDVFLI